MLDSVLRPIKERVLAPLAVRVDHRVSPMTVTIAAFIAGMTAALFAAQGMQGAALAAWVVNRVLDGFDGTLARTQGTQSDLGGYVDLLLDFVVYASIPIALVVGTPPAARQALTLSALFLLSVFYINAASWMYLSAVLERRGAGARARGELTSVTMPDGLIGGTETIALYTLFFLWPAQLGPLFTLMTLLVSATIGQRLWWAARSL